MVFDKKVNKFAVAFCGVLLLLFVAGLSSFYLSENVSFSPDEELMTKQSKDRYNMELQKVLDIEYASNGDGEIYTPPICRRLISSSCTNYCSRYYCQLPHNQYPFCEVECYSRCMSIYGNEWLRICESSGLPSLIPEQ